VQAQGDEENIWTEEAIEKLDIMSNLQELDVDGRIR
jgi:hypothetical protein